MSEALRKENVRLAAYYVSGITGVVILSMSVMRESSACLPQAIFPSGTICSENPVVCVSAISGAFYRRRNAVVRDAEAVRVICRSSGRAGKTERDAGAHRGGEAAMRYRVFSSIALALACRRYLLRSPSGASQTGP